MIELIKTTKTKDADGYKTAEEQKREVFCTFAEGASRSEYYEAMKAGVRVSATVEVWEDDYEGERMLAYDGRRFEIGRSYPTGSGTLLLYLTEVWR